LYEFPDACKIRGNGGLQIWQSTDYGSIIPIYKV